MANVTGNGNFTAKLNQQLSASTAGTVKFFSALNIFLSITATLGNILILVALHKISSIYPPTKLFLLCLAVTDLCVGLIVQPLYLTYIMSPLTNMNVNILDFVANVCWALSLKLGGVSILTSTAISVDRLLALLLGLRYRHVVTLRRARVAIFCFWLIGVSGGSLRMWRRDIALREVFVVIIISLVTSIFCYTRIYLKLRHHQAQVQNNVPQGQPSETRLPLNIARYKKSVSNIMWVQLALVACYFPFGIVSLLFVNGIENYEAWIAATSLCYLNSSLNPILYCWKITEMRQAVKNIIRQLCCF
ncbi:adenosine receptor A3-like [Oculina patagonica]